MAKRLLDANKLYPFYRKKRRKTAHPSRDIAAAWARELADLHGGAAIATPTLLEFIGGVTDRQEMETALAFIEGFENIDGGMIAREDWQIAQERAQRIGPSGKPRQAIDCLLFAIARRLNCDLITDDRDLRRRQ